jgi:ATP-dependent 26S proteasome regulatory subunit
VTPNAIEEVICVGEDRNQYQIHIPLPPKIDPTVTMLQEEEKPDVTYSDVGGFKEQTGKLSEVMETPLLHVIQPLSYIFIKERPISLISFAAGDIRESWH